MIKVKRLYPVAKLPTRFYHSASYDLWKKNMLDEVSLNLLLLFHIHRSHVYEIYDSSIKRH